MPPNNTPPALRLCYDDSRPVPERVAERHPLLSSSREDMTHRGCEAGDVAAATSSHDAHVMVVGDSEDVTLSSGVAGADVVLQDVALVGSSTAPWYHHLSCLPCPTSRHHVVEFVCQPTNMLWHAGRLHLVVDAHDTVGGALLELLCGRRVCATGAVYVNGVPASATTLRRVVRCVTDRDSASDAAMLWRHMSIEQNLSLCYDVCFADADAEARKTRRVRRVQKMTEFVQLVPHQLVRDLSADERFRLQLAMQLMRDCSVLAVQYDLAALNAAATTACVQLLRAITTTLHKTVVVITHSLPPHILPCAETLLLYGCGGHVLYAGPVRDLVAYLPHLPHAPPTVSDPTDASYLASATLSSAATHLHAVRRAALEGGSTQETTTAAVGVTPRSSTLPSKTCATHGLCGTHHETRSSRQEQNRVIASAEDLCDNAAVWSEVRSLFYAAVFYDSANYARLLRCIERHVHQIGTEGRPSVADSEASRLVGHNEDVHVPPHVACKPLVLLCYELYAVRTNTALLCEMAVLGLSAACLVCLLGRQSVDQGSMYNVRGSLFVLFALPLLLNTVATHNMAAQLRRYRVCCDGGRIRDALSFVVYLQLYVLLVRLCQLVLYVPVVLLMHVTASHVLLYVYAVSVTHALLLYVTSALALSSAQVVRRCAYAYLVYALVCSGFLINLRSAPRILGYGSVLRWGYGGALYERLAGEPWICDGVGRSSYCSSGDDYLVLQGFDTETIKRTFCVLGGISIALLLVLIGTLYCRTL